MNFVLMEGYSEAYLGKALHRSFLIFGYEEYLHLKYILSDAYSSE